MADDRVLEANLDLVAPNELAAPRIEDVGDVLYAYSERDNPENKGFDWTAAGLDKAAHDLAATGPYEGSIYQYTGTTDHADTVRQHMMEAGLGYDMLNDQGGRAAGGNDARGPRKDRDRSRGYDAITQSVLASLSPNTQAYLDKTMDRVQDIMGDPDMSDEERLRELRRMYQEAYDRLIEEGLSHEEAMAHLSELEENIAIVQERLEMAKIADASAALEADRLFRDHGKFDLTLYYQDHENVANLRERHEASLETLRLIDDTIAKYGTSSELEEAKESVTNTIAGQQQVLDIIDLKGGDFTDFELPEMAKQGMDKRFGGEEGYRKYLEQAGASPEEIERLMDMNAKIDKRLADNSADLRGFREDFNSKDLARSSDLDLWADNYNAPPVQDYYIFQDEDGSFKLLGANWTDQDTQITISEHTMPGIFEEIQTKINTGELNVGSHEDYNAYLESADNLTLTQVMSGFYDKDEISSLPSEEEPEQDPAEQYGSTLSGAAPSF